ncbi:YqhG family protein [Cohnella sp.]|uniref:YqhG family protein n=1 Tax=Cohnella sp. TaxID=1883426 RepID=UPI0035677B93
MNAKQVQKFVLSYLDSTGCQLIEKSPNRITVKLSPKADRSLTNRPFYWSFVDRAGVDPETMTYGWSFENPSTEQGSSGSLISYLMTDNGRIVQEDIYFGSRRLHQLFEAVRQEGRCVTMFEEPSRGRLDPLGSQPYTAWLGVNFKVSFECDMKREEIYGWGISLATGIIDENFLETLKDRKLSSRLPSNVHLLRNGLSLRKGMSQLELTMERKLKNVDFSWAEDAERRRQDELQRIKHYYAPMLEAMEPSVQREELAIRSQQREAEIDWQYRPRVSLSVMNCGIFHLPGIH